MSHTPPQNLEAEENVIGAMLQSPRAIEEAGELLRPEDFYRASHGIMFRAMLDLAAADEPVDGVLLADKLSRMGKLEDVGGQGKLAELVALTPSTQNVGHYARVVAAESSRRALLKAASSITQDVTSGGDVSELIAQAEAHLSAATTLRAQANALPITDDLSEYRAELLAAYTSKTPIFGERTGFTDLDNMLLGFWPGQLIVCAARPGQGKSAFALNVAENYADREAPVLILSLEMARRELLIRSLARSSRIDSKRLQTGQIEVAHAPKLKEALTAVEKRGPKLLVEDNGTMSMPELRATAARMQRQVGLRLIVVDYVQLMQGIGDNTNDQIGSITRGLKQLARQLNIPILALSQMNRGIENRGGDDKRPTLSDLRGSGSLEQDADVVMFLHDPSAYDTSKTADGTTEVIIAKNRKGETGSVKLLFLRRFSTFATPANNPGGTE